MINELLRHLSDDSSSVDVEGPPVLLRELQLSRALCATGQYQHALRHDALVHLVDRLSHLRDLHADPHRMSQRFPPT